MSEVRQTPRAMRSDGVHYNARGADVLARFIFQKIKPLLAS
jgi:lysophospholipase L1-like esterase